MTSPQEIQRDIEQTRVSLSADVDRLSDKVSPSKVVGRRVDRIKSASTSAKDRIMGSAESARSSGGGATQTLASAASSMSDAAGSAPRAVRQQTQGNPLAAGLIAFGVGWLVSSTIPASQREQDLARAAQDKAGDLAQPVKEQAQEVAANLQEPMKQSAEQIKATATDAASQTVDHAKSAAADVKQPLQQ
jgi:hypothetical protein